MSARALDSAIGGEAARARVLGLRQSYGSLDGAPLIAAMREEFPGQMAVISSFGAESAVLLDLVAQVDRTIPVIFLNTNELFDETVVYQQALGDFLGLADLRIIRPDAEVLNQVDELWRTDPDACCHVRKVVPLARASAGFRALVDGRKRFHAGGRLGMDTIQLDESGVVKISPLARWSEEQIEGAFVDRGLPRHPLVAQGYRSIGCWPCSTPTEPGRPVRYGRWAGLAKTECGIHKVLDYTI
jgi:phosphoadenosine phosphosulfate reductase